MKTHAVDRMVSVFHREGGRLLRKAGTLLCAAAVLVVGNVSPLLDLGYSSVDGVHVEVPEGPAHEHFAHNHALCGIIATAHVLPGVEPAAPHVSAREATCFPAASDAIRLSLQFPVHRSRAPPTV